MNASTFAALINLAAFVVGVVCLSLAFNWMLGVGIGMLVWFHKTPESM